MNEKEKAKELIEKFYNTLPQWVNYEDAKQCALICVNEMIKHFEQFEPWLGVEFWQNVKTEIENYQV